VSSSRSRDLARNDALVDAECLGDAPDVTPSLTLPHARRAVRGNSSIAEAQLIFGALALRAAWVDGRGFIDGAEVAALEEAQSDQIGEAQDRDLDAMAAGGEAQRRIGDHRGKDLEADRVVVVAKKAADVEVLFDPAKQELDLPSGLVEGGDVEAARSRSLVSRAMVLPSVRWTRSRRNRIGSFWPSAPHCPRAR
jgi:hypothetical protein